MQLRATAGSQVRFSAEAYPQRTRHAMWRENMRRYVGLDLEPLVKDGGTILGDSISIALSGVGLAISNTSAQAVRRTPELLSDGKDYLRLVILSESRTAAIAMQSGQEMTIAPGGAVVLSNSEQNSFTFLSPARSLVLNLRREIMRPLLHDFDTVIGRPIAKQIEGLQLLSKYVEALTQQPALHSTDLERLIVAQVYDLAAVIMGATRDAAETAKGRGVRAARLHAIKVDIAENLASPTLSVDSVALRQRVSPRYVQMLFEQEGTTFSQYVIGQRLVRAQRILTDPRFADRSITSVAFDAGFGDLSYFNRAFRRCYGATPSEVRAGAVRRRLGM